MWECRSCGAGFDERYRFCPWCGAVQRLKIVEYFAALPFASDDVTKGLRVSRYLERPGHIRFSVWRPGHVDAAISISEPEGRRLAAFLTATDPQGRLPLAHRLRQSAHALSETLRASR